MTLPFFTLTITSFTFARALAATVGYACSPTTTANRIPGLGRTAGEQAYPYGFKVPWTSGNSGVMFTDDVNWTYTFEANVTNMFNAIAKKTPSTAPAR